MKFDDWFNQLDGFSSRLERAYDELVLGRYNDNHSFWQTVLSWLKVVYNIGYEQGKKRFTQEKRESVMIPTVTKAITLTKDEVKNMLIKYLHRYHHVSGIFDVQFLIDYKPNNNGSNIHDTSSSCEFHGVKIEVSENVSSTI